MQTNFDKIPGFSKKFRFKRYFDEISLHFHDTNCFDLHDFFYVISLCSMIHPEFSSDNSLLSKSRCNFLNENSIYCLSRQTPVSTRACIACCKKTFAPMFASHLQRLSVTDVLQRFFPFRKLRFSEHQSNVSMTITMSGVS